MIKKELIQEPEREGVVFVLERGGQLLVEQRLKEGSGYYGKKIFPGGRKENGETFSEAARREIEEELGVSDGDLQELDTFEDNTSSGNYYRFRAFLLRGFSNEPKNQAPAICRFEWMNVDQAEEELTLASRRLILFKAREFIEGEERMD